MTELRTCRRCGANAYGLICTPIGFYHGQQIGVMALLDCPCPPIPGGWPKSMALEVQRAARYAARARFRCDAKDEMAARDEAVTIMHALGQQVPVGYLAPHELAEVGQRWFADAYEAELAQWAN